MRARSLRAGLAVAACAAATLAPAPASAIVGGSPASAGTFPSLALISDDLGGGQTAYCTATVVSANVVLTAAHCLADESGTPEPLSGFRVDTASLDPSEAPGQQSGVSAVAIYPAFDPLADDGDAGVLVLATPTSAPPVTLAGSADGARLANQIPVVIAGWGLTSANATAEPAVAQRAGMTSQTGLYCSQHADLHFDENTEFCATDPGSNAITVCNGDSGGPAFVQGPGATQIELGIVDRGASCDPSKPSIFTRVDQVSAWVQGQIAAHPPSAPAPAPAPSPPAAAAAPVVSVAPPAGAIAAPLDGRYAGRSAQRRGSVALTVSAGALTGVRIAFNLRCGGAWLGPITKSKVWHTSSPALVPAHGAWTFSTRYTGGGYVYAVSGTVSGAGRASGTLKVATHSPRCSSGAISWRATAATG